MVGRDLVGPSNPVNPTRPAILPKTGMLANSQPAMFSFFIFSFFLKLAEQGERRGGLIFCCQVQVKAESTEIARPSKK